MYLFFNIRSVELQELALMTPMMKQRAAGSHKNLKSVNFKITAEMNHVQRVKITVSNARECSNTPSTSH